MAIYSNGSTQRAKNAARTKKKIFKTAISLFAKYSFKDVTVDDICKKAGVSKGAFYLHFPSKESLLIEQFNEIESYYDSLYDQYADLQTASEKVLTIIDGMMDYFVNELGVQTVTVIYASHLTSNQSINMLLDDSRKIHKVLCEIVEEGLESGEFPDVFSVDSLTRMLMRTARSVVYDWCMRNGENDIRKEAHGYFSVILALIRSTSLGAEDPVWEYVKKSDQYLENSKKEKEVS